MKCKKFVKSANLLANLDEIIIYHVRHLRFFLKLELSASVFEDFHLVLAGKYGRHYILFQIVFAFIFENPISAKFKVFNLIKLVPMIITQHTYTTNNISKLQYSVQEF